MPTAHVGDKANTQAPSVKPQPDGPITVNLPADGDPPNASTFAQAYKALADWIDFLLRPTAKPSAWDGEIQAWRTSTGHRRFAVDHLGFPAGQLLTYDALWKQADVAGFGSTKTGTSTGVQFGTMPDWKYKASETIGPCSATLTSNAFGPLLQTFAGQWVGDYVMVTGNIAFGALRADNHFVFQTSAYGIETPSREVHLGLFDTAAGAGLGSAPNFIGFRLAASGLWQCVTRASATETVTSGSAAPAVSVSRAPRLRVEWHGESVSDNGVRAVRFYIDGALAATHTTNLPLGSVVIPGVSDLRIATPSGADAYLRVGPLRVQASLHHGDVVL